MYALVKNNKVVEYPLSVFDWRRKNPNVSLPAEPTSSQLASVGLHLVNQTPEPAIDYTQTAVSEVVFADNNWTLQWNVLPATAVQQAVNKRAIESSITAQIQQRLDSFAQTRDYTNIDTASKYKDISDQEIALIPQEEQLLVQKFRAESRYISIAAARTWAKFVLIFQEVYSGARAMPAGYSEIESELPELIWPTVETTQG
jgi:hypothetical protein